MTASTKYSSISLELDEDDVNVFERPRNNKRWSILEKLDRRHYCRIRNCKDCLKITNWKCLLATAMLGSFVMLAISFARFVIFSTYDGVDLMPFDFIIVGAGPAGSIIARKMIDRGAKVLLLEAGGSPTQHDLGGLDSFGGPVSRFDIPLFWSSVPHFTEFHWQDFNLPNVMIAKGLGGCGIHNAMLYVRALASDIDNWALHGWHWSKIFKIYNDLETYSLQSTESETPPYHGTSGPVTTSRPLYVDQIAPEFISSAVHAGISFTEDFNKPGSRVGVGYYHFNIKGGIRDSAAREFLGPMLMNMKDYPNLRVVTGAVVNRVLLEEVKAPSDDHSHANQKPQFRATGVEFEKDGQLFTSYLKTDTDISYFFDPTGSPPGIESGRSVVITAGALMTPKILMNSGIGDPEILKRAGVDVSVSSKMVGRNLQDHPVVGVTFKLSAALAASYPSAFEMPNSLVKYLYAVQQFQATKEGTAPVAEDYGVLGSTGFSAGGFLVSPFASNGIPDIQLTVFPTMMEPHLIQRKWLVDATPPEVTMNENSMLITVALLNPEARYQIVLNSSDPLHAPPNVILPEDRTTYLSELDQSKISWGISTVRKIFATPPLQQLAGEEVSPGAAVQDNALRDWIRQNAFPNSHWVGSAAMGSTEDSVLDEEMRVRGVKNLRVADASAIPRIPNGNVHSTVLVMSVMASEFILSSGITSLNVTSSSLRH